MAFELCYLPDMPDVLRSLARNSKDGGDGTIEAWWTRLEAAAKPSDGAMKTVNILAMAAHYDPDPTQFLGLRLPVTADTCEIIPERWANWLAHDPVVKLERQAEALRGLKALYIDCGVNDQFNLLYGQPDASTAGWEELGIAHRYEEFPDNHSSRSITGWTRACRSWPRRWPDEIWRRKALRIGAGTE